MIDKISSDATSKDVMWNLYMYLIIIIVGVVNNE